MDRAFVVKAATILFAAALCGYAASDHPFYGGGPGFGVVQTLIALAGAVLALGAILPFGWNARLLASFGAGVFALLAAELLCERLFAARYRPSFVEHDERIFTLRPGCEGVFLRTTENGGDHVPWRINQAGFRGPKPLGMAEEKRVFVYGDSFVHAPYCLEEGTFVHQLGVALDDPSVTAINAGVSSYGPDQVYLRLHEEIAAYKMGLIVVAVFAGNDHGDLVRNRLFDIAPDGGLRSRNWTLDPTIATTLRLGSSSSMLLTFIRRMKARSAIITRDLPSGPQRFELMESWLEDSQRDFKRSILEHDPVIDNIYVDQYDADVALTPSGQSADFKRRLMSATLEAIVSTARANCVPIAFVVIPHPIDVCDEYDSAQVDLERYPEYRRTNLTGSIVARLRELTVPTVDLFEVFSTEGANGLYFRAGDDHWNEAGQSLAATATARLIQDEALLAR